MAEVMSYNNISLYLGDRLLDIGGNRNKADKMPIVNHGTSDTTFALTPNIYHKWGIVSSLILTLVAPTDNTIVNEYIFQFACGSTVTTLSLPAGVRWIGGTPVLEANTTYQVSIIDNIAVIGGAYD